MNRPISGSVIFWPAIGGLKLGEKKLFLSTEYLIDLANPDFRLNEGFARYFQFFGTEMIQTGWEMEEQFVIENHQNSMQLDATDQTHAMTKISPPVQTKADASVMFDNISYSKAASVIRMLKHYIGLEKFQETLKTYLADK